MNALIFFCILRSKSVIQLSWNELGPHKFVLLPKIMPPSPMAVVDFLFLFLNFFFFSYFPLLFV